MLDMIGPYALDSIITGDARELAKAIPDESIDLIFTDPVYDRIDDYRWLAKTAARVLKPNGNALAFVNSKWHGMILQHVPTSLPTLTAIQTSGPSPMNGRVIAKSYHLVWYGSGVLVGYMPDGYIASTWSSPNGHNHKWTKNPRYLIAVLTAFTNPAAIVWDPFTGGGTVPAVCKMLRRNYLAFEIDADTAERARQRVLTTQEPLVFPEHEQLTFDTTAAS